jgi:hypothetical protein
MRAIQACALAALALCLSACITLSADKLRDLSPPEATFKPFVAHSVAESFSFHLDGGKMVTSNFAGRAINEAVLERWQAMGRVRGSAYAEHPESAADADYELVLDGTQTGGSSVVMQVLSGLTLLLLPYSVNTEYDLRYTLRERKTGRTFTAGANDGFETVVSLLLLPVSPFFQGGRVRTFNRLGDHVYQELYDQGAFRESPVSAVAPGTQ